MHKIALYNAYAEATATRRKAREETVKDIHPDRISATFLESDILCPSLFEEKRIEEAVLQHFNALPVATSARPAAPLPVAVKQF